MSKIVYILPTDVTTVYTCMYVCVYVLANVIPSGMFSCDTIQVTFYDYYPIMRKPYNN